MPVFKVTVSVILDAAATREQALHTVVHDFVPKDVQVLRPRVVEVEKFGDDWLEKPETEWS